MGWHLDVGLGDPHDAAVMTRWFVQPHISYMS